MLLFIFEFIIFEEESVVVDGVIFNECLCDSIDTNLLLMNLDDFNIILFFITLLIVQLLPVLIIVIKLTISIELIDSHKKNTVT